MKHVRYSYRYDAWIEPPKWWMPARAWWYVPPEGFLFSLRDGRWRWRWHFETPLY